MRTDPSHPPFARGGRRAALPLALAPTLWCVGLTALPMPLVGQDPDAGTRTVAEVLAATTDAEWRLLDPAHTVHLYLPAGRVVVELAPEFAPRHVANIEALVRGGFFDGGAINRSQDNYVVQWGTRRRGDREEGPRAGIASTLPAEFEVASDGLPFTPLPDGDVYAPEAGFVRGFPVGRDPETGHAWMAHCYGVVGVARGTDPDSGSGAELYVVIGHAPRHLDRNLSMVGRVVAGMEYLSTLPRGRAALGRYESEDQWVPFDAVRMADELPAEQRVDVHVLRTDSRSFTDLIQAARSRTEDFFVEPTDRIGLCNVPLPIRISANPGG